MTKHRVQSLVQQHPVLDGVDARNLKLRDGVVRIEAILDNDFDVLEDALAVK
jgi:hypothetical protein